MTPSGKALSRGSRAQTGGLDDARAHKHPACSFRSCLEQINLLSVLCSCYRIAPNRLSHQQRWQPCWKCRSATCRTFLQVGYGHALASRESLLQIAHCTYRPPCASAIAYIKKEYPSRSSYVLFFSINFSVKFGTLHGRATQWYILAP